MCRIYAIEASQITARSILSRLGNVVTQMIRLELNKLHVLLICFIFLWFASRIIALAGTVVLFLFCCSVHMLLHPGAVSFFSVAPLCL